MWSADKQGRRCRTAWNQASLISAALLITMISGCGSGVSSNQQPANQQTATQTSPQRYLAPLVAASTDGVSPLNSPQIYTIDDVGKAFSQTSYLLHPPQQEGAQILNSGVVSNLSRGLLSLGLTAHYTLNSSTNVYNSTIYNPPQTGGFALELAGQAGGLVQHLGQPVAPLVPTANCPNISTAETYNFITIPTYLQNSASQASGWSPTTQTAYGSVDISSSGSSVNFNNIQQFTFPSDGASGTPSNPSAPSVAAVCGQTAYGNTISIPGQIIVTNPGVGNSSPPQAIAGIGSTGLLVEDNGLIATGNNVGAYQNALGAGTGAVGLPKPSSALDTNAIVGAQYLGFVYGSGVFTNASPSGGWSSHLASFGFSNVPSSYCDSVATGTNTTIYGGDFDPSTSTNGFGDCDLALDLGVQSPTSNGLYPNAKVWIGTGYATNATKPKYSFPAVAIAGQLQGKSVIFLLGVDSTQAWAIYLFQSN